MVFMTYLGCLVVMMIGIFLLIVGVQLLAGAAFSGGSHPAHLIPLGLGASLIWLGAHLMPFTVVFGA